MSTTTRPLTLTPCEQAVLDDEDPFGLVDRAAAFSAGYDLGLVHGRQLERTLIDQEATARAAGRLVSRLADFPEVDPADARRRALERDRRFAS